MWTECSGMHNRGIVTAARSVGRRQFAEWVHRMTSHCEELQVHSATLHGVVPFPTYHSTIAAPVTCTRAFCSVLSAAGELVVLQPSRAGPSQQDVQDHSFRVVAVLPPPLAIRIASFCQCWLPDGSLVAVAHDCRVVFYSTDAFQVQRQVQVRYSVTAMDIVVRKKEERRQTVDEEERVDGVELLLLVATAFGAFVYVVALEKSGQEAQDSSRDETLELLLAPVAAVHTGVAMCMVKFSSDGCTAAMGSVDGRLFLRALGSHDDHTLATCGTVVFSKVLPAPRVTSLCFSLCSTQLVAATRNGNVYVYTLSTETRRWRSLPRGADLDRHPKAGGRAGPHRAGTAAQTLVACWGASVFVACARASASRLDMHDLVSGYRLRSLQFAPSSTAGSSCGLSQWTDQHVVTGICSMRTRDGGPSWLLVHDATSKVRVVTWPFLDVVAG